MPPTRSSAQRRALALSRSLAHALVPNFIVSFFTRPQPQQVHYPYPNYIFHPPPPPPPPVPPPPSRIPDISRPRNLRRTHASRRHRRYSSNHYRPAVRSHFITHLPFEILSHIFVLGAEEDTTLPVVVSHVCRAWRQIALHTPKLWRRISLSPHERIWRERIHRARACTLDVELLPWRAVRGGGRRSQELNAYSVQWYMHLVLPHLHRWRTFDVLFTDYSPYLWNAALVGCTLPAPTLEEMSLVYRHNDNVQEFALFSESAPRLRRLTVDGIRLAWSSRMYGNLTFLDYTHHGFTSRHQAVHDVISILAVLPRLVELRLLFPRGQKVSRLPSRRDQATKRVRLRHLAELQLAVDGSDIPFELAQLVTLITMPRLSTLRLVDLSRGHHPFPNLKSFFYIFPLPRTLHHIQIGHGWYDPKMVHPLTQSLPQLAKIVLRRSRMPEQVLDMNHRIKQTGSVIRTHESTQRHYRMDRPSSQYVAVKAY